MLDHHVRPIMLSLPPELIDIIVKYDRNVLPTLKSVHRKFYHQYKIPFEEFDARNRQQIDFAHQFPERLCEVKTFIGSIDSDNAIDVCSFMPFLRNCQHFVIAKKYKPRIPYVSYSDMKTLTILDGGFSDSNFDTIFNFLKRFALKRLVYISDGESSHGYRLKKVARNEMFFSNQASRWNRFRFEHIIIDVPFDHVKTQLRARHKSYVYLLYCKSLSIL